MGKRALSLALHFLKVEAAIRVLFDRTAESVEAGLCSGDALARPHLHGGGSYLHVHMRGSVRRGWPASKTMGNVPKGGPLLQHQAIRAREELNVHRRGVHVRLGGPLQLRCHVHPDHLDWREAAFELSASLLVHGGNDEDRRVRSGETLAKASERVRRLHGSA